MDSAQRAPVVPGASLMPDAAQPWAQNLAQWQTMLQEYYKQNPMAAATAAYPNPLAYGGVWGSNQPLLAAYTSALGPFYSGMFAAPFSNPGVPGAAQGAMQLPNAAAAAPAGASGQEQNHAQGGAVSKGTTTGTTGGSDDDDSGSDEEDEKHSAKRVKAEGADGEGKGDKDNHVTAASAAAAQAAAVSAAAAAVNLPAHLQYAAWPQGALPPAVNGLTDSAFLGMEEKEAKKLRRKQSNRESARRSRLRKQAETEGLAQTLKGFVAENATLKQTMEALKAMVERLSAEKLALISQVRSLGGQVAPELEAFPTAGGWAVQPGAHAQQVAAAAAGAQAAAAGQGQQQQSADAAQQ